MPLKASYTIPVTVLKKFKTKPPNNDGKKFRLKCKKITTCKFVKVYFRGKNVFEAFYI